MCLVYQDDFETFNRDVWTHEVQLDGFGTGSFDWTTDDKTNSYVDGAGLHIVPTLTNETTSITNDQQQRQRCCYLQACLPRRYLAEMNGHHKQGGLQRLQPACSSARPNQSVKLNQPLVLYRGTPRTGHHHVRCRALWHKLQKLFIGLENVDAADVSTARGAA